MLQHVPSREAVIAKLIDALKPGGWLVLEDGQFMGFGEQGLAEPYRTSTRSSPPAEQEESPRDPNFGLQILDRMRAPRARRTRCRGRPWAMRPGDPSGEWWFLALERAMPHLVAAGLVTATTERRRWLRSANPGFVMLSPASIATIGRKPTTASTVGPAGSG